MKTWPLWGRDEELDRIAGAMEAADTGGIVLAGEAGVGKTRLVQEAVSLAGRNELRTAWAAGTEAARSIPFGALAHLVPASLPAARNRDNAIRAVAETMLPQEGDRLVLGIDDAHVLDDHSAVLVLHLARSSRVFVVAALRSRHPAPAPVVALWKDQICARLDLQALPEPEVGALLEAVLGGQVEGATRRWLWDVTRGNPLYLREVVLAGVEAGNLIRADSVWRWVGPFARSARLADVIASRLARLPMEQRRATELVAATEPIELELLVALASERVLQDLEEADLLTEERDGRRIRVTSSHPLYAASIRAGATPARARQAYRLAADALERTGGRRQDDSLRVATWRLESGAPGEWGPLLRAARRALSLYDFGLAARLARAAAEAGGGFEAMRTLSEALVGEGSFAEAESILAGAQPSTERERGALAILRATNLFWRLGDRRSAEQLIHETETTTSDQRARAVLAATRAELLVHGGSTSEAIDLAISLLERFATDETPALQAAAAGSLALALAGRTREAAALVARYLPAAEALASEAPLARDWLRGVSYLALVLDGRLADAIAHYIDAYGQLLDRPGSDAPRAIWAFFLGWSHRMQGKPATASRYLRDALPMLREADLFTHLAACLAELAHCSALLGDHGTAEELLSEAEAARVPSFRVDEVHIALARVWTLAARDETSSAAKSALEAAQRLRSMNHRIHAATALHDAARLGRARDAVNALRGLAAEVDGALVTAFERHAVALHIRDAAALADASMRFERMGAHLWAAEAAAEAAHVNRERGRSATGHAAAGRAVALAGRCEGARTPALAGADRPLPLTPRELEVATLAARGLSNRDIAARLVVSVRTVDNQLHRAYQKLGVTSRHELRAIFDPSLRKHGY